MRDVVQFPGSPARDVYTETDLDRIRAKLQLELVLLQSDLAVIGFKMTQNNESHAGRVLDCSATAGRIWEMLR